MDIKIIEIIDKKTKNQIDVDKLSLKHIIVDAKKPIWRFIIDGKEVKKNNSYQVTYVCPNCSRHNIVCLNILTDKINRGINTCNTCNTHMKPEKLLDKLHLDADVFEAYDDDFKNIYFRKNLTTDEFERIRNTIVSFQNGKFDMNNFIYYPCVSVSNQQRFSPFVYDIKRDVIEKLMYIKFACEKCGNHFINKDIHVQKNKYKILCQDCSFCNKAFKISSTKNCMDQLITYKSKFELKFINFCNENGILINNGPNVKYFINDKEHNYKVDFIIKDMLIEVRDNHYWKQLQSGKLEIKNTVILEYAKANGFQHKVIYPRIYMEFRKEVLKS